MTQLAEVMTIDVQVVNPDESILRAAQMMKELDVGALPVCDGERLIGMVTDRDIAIRGVADGLEPEETTVADVMTDEITWCTDEQEVEEAMQLMSDRQIRRLPIVDANKRLVGIVSIADLSSEHPGIGEAVERISSPSSGPMGGTG